MKTLVFDITSHVPLFVTLYLREKAEQERHIRSPASSHLMAAPFMACDTFTLTLFWFCWDRGVHWSSLDHKYFNTTFKAFFLNTKTQISLS